MYTTFSKTIVFLFRGKPCNYLLVLTAHIYSVDFTSIISAKVFLCLASMLKTPIFVRLLYYSSKFIVLPNLPYKGLQFTLSRLARGYFRYILIFLTLRNFLSSNSDSMSSSSTSRKQSAIVNFNASVLRQSA